MRFQFPAVFTPEEVGGFSIYFPDLEGAYSQGEDWSDAYKNAQECLALSIEELLDEEKPIPSSSAISDVIHKPGELVVLVTIDFALENTGK